MNPAVVLLAGGLLALPAFTFQQHLLLKLLQCILAIAFAAGSGRKIRAVPSAMVAGAIIVVHLLSPLGRVLLRLGGFPVTLGALATGLDRAVLMIGLVAISRYAVRADAFRPGGDSLAGLVMGYFEILTDSRGRSSRIRSLRNLGGVVRWIDELLLSVYSGEATEGAFPTIPSGNPPASRGTGIGWPTIFVALNWALFILGRIGIVPDLPDFL